MATFLNVQGYLGECSSYFTVFGVLTAAYFALKSSCSICRFIRDYFLGPALGLSANVKKAGSWAVITGCTDGIGKAYTEQLAKKGLNVVLLSRTRSKLDDLAKDIESKYKVQTKVIAVDFTQSNFYDRIARELEGLNIGTLVNNVGMSYEMPTYFLEVPETEKMIKDMLNCNIVSMLMMTSIVLPGMVERHRGYVINIASAAAERPLPLLALYSASKVYMDYFTKALQIEYGSKGVTCQSVRPNFVATKMSGIKRQNLIAPYPEQFVQSALGTLGLSNSTNGFWIHTIQSYVQQFAPDFMLLKTLNAARKAAIRRKERKKTQ